MWDLPLGGAWLTEELVNVTDVPYTGTGSALLQKLF